MEGKPIAVSVGIVLLALAIGAITAAFTIHAVGEGWLNINKLIASYGASSKVVFFWSWAGIVFLMSLLIVALVYAAYNAFARS
ncbi:MAG: hypothetical protein DRJ68_00615 [Thermoprotei archaeon]|nr:MAG: hypothetical protein DRJ68_00615 [Thermoprotei archaeon]